MTRPNVAESGHRFWGGRDADEAAFDVDRLRTTFMVGTIITMALPFLWVNTEADAIAEVKPYTAIELAGRDIYVREGCNNCHSQTVRPLEADVKRYGEYSRSGEFVYEDYVKQPNSEALDDELVEKVWVLSMSQVGLGTASPP